MKLTDERIEEIKSLFQPDGRVRQQDKAYFCRRAETAIPELLSEREEREKKIGRLRDDLAGSEHARNALRSKAVELLTRVESVEKALEALRDWALTARRLWGGGGGVHWKSFYAILDIGKGE